MQASPQLNVPEHRGNKVRARRRPEAGSRVCSCYMFSAKKSLSVHCSCATLSASLGLCLHGTNDGPWNPRVSTGLLHRALSLLPHSILYLLHALSKLGSTVHSFLRSPSSTLPKSSWMPGQVTHGSSSLCLYSWFVFAALNTV